jgi:hypothetical protein
MIVFYMPVLLGQSPASMVGWGFLTTIPAVIAALYTSGRVCKFALEKFELAGAEIHPVAIGAIQVCGAYVLLMVLSGFGL